MWKDMLEEWALIGAQKWENINPQEEALKKNGN